MGSPSVQIITPASQAIYNVHDTVWVSAKVSDDNGLNTVSVYLINNLGTQVLPNAVVKITSKSFTFKIAYVLSDIHLISGQYSIVVFASNGTNSTYAYQQISVDATPTKREAIYAITKSGSGVHVSKIDSVFNVSLAYTNPGDYSSSDVNSYYQQLYVTASDTGSVNANSVPGGSNAWSVPGIISSPVYFTNTYSSGDAVYISFYNGYVRYYNSLGVLQSVFSIEANYYPIKTYAYSNYLFVEEKAISSKTTNLVVFYSATTASMQQALLPGPVTAMFDMDNDHIMVFGNDYTGVPYMLQYSISNNIFFSPITLPAATLLSAEQVDANTYLMGYSNGNIYQYTYNPNVMNTFAGGVMASHIRYDVVNNQVIVATAHYIKEYNYVSGALVNTADLIDSVLNVHILNNK